jgi:hypothetical protein
MTDQFSSEEQKLHETRIIGSEQSSEENVSESSNWKQKTIKYALKNHMVNMNRIINFSKNAITSGIGAIADLSKNALHLECRNMDLYENLDVYTIKSRGDEYYFKCKNGTKIITGLPKNFNKTQPYEGKLTITSGTEPIEIPVKISVFYGYTNHNCLPFNKMTKIKDRNLDDYVYNYYGYCYSSDRIFIFEDIAPNGFEVYYPFDYVLYLYKTKHRFDFDNKRLNLGVVKKLLDSLYNLHSSNIVLEKVNYNNNIALFIPNITSTEFIANIKAKFLVDNSCLINIDNDCKFYTDMPSSEKNYISPELAKIYFEDGLEEYKKMLIMNKYENYKKQNIWSLGILIYYICIGEEKFHERGNNNYQFISNMNQQYVDNIIDSSNYMCIDDNIDYFDLIKFRDAHFDFSEREFSVHSFLKSILKNLLAINIENREIKQYDSYFFEYLEKLRVENQIRTKRNIERRQREIEELNARERKFEEEQQRLEEERMKDPFYRYRHSSRK